ncbi:cbb3-type cytochrome c oxidase subunit I [Sulfurimonas sp. HSL1-6]|uniref:cytochrome c oxidase subunit I n=1 Tax=Thiomicrolovo immobilis TaxID=3131935 RepID=UPI0031F73EBF
MPSFYHETHTLFGHLRNPVLQWIFSIDHKRIGLMYMVLMFTLFFLAVGAALTMRAELFAPGAQFLEPQTYNELFTFHGVTMIFLFIVPGIPATLGNFLLPLMLGAHDVSFPRLNLISFWFYVLGVILGISSLVTGQGFADTGWTFYAPYSIRTDAHVLSTLSAAFILGLSSILTGLNFIVTIHRLRAPGMGFFKMPLFIWGLYATAWIQVLATPVVGITLLLVILERTLGIGIFDPTKGGDPVLFEHLFWIYSHPAVYLMILPGFGIVSEVLPAFTRRTIFGYHAIAISSASIAGIGYLVWGHHMYTSGMSDIARVIFSFLTFLVAVPTGVKIFDWVATMYKGSIVLATPMLWILGSIINFTVGGLTGLTLGAIGPDIHLHDTYYVVAHFHYTILGGVIFMFIGGLHYWYPKITGKLYDEGLARIAFGLAFVGFNMLWFPMFLAGFFGNPRRYFDYLPDFTVYHQISGVGALLIASGLVMIVYTFYRGLRSGRDAGPNPWNATTLEWHIPSPPPLENFPKIPYVDFEPYEYEAGEPLVQFDENFRRIR